MTTGRVILHEERHTKAFSQKGSALEIVQLWVNLPAKDKTLSPRYQEIPNMPIPVIRLPDQAGTVRGNLETLRVLHLLSYPFICGIYTFKCRERIKPAIT